MLFNIPSKEKILKSVESTVITEFKFCISAEKEISSFKTVAPTPLMESEIIYVKSINSSHI